MPRAERAEPAASMQALVLEEFGRMQLVTRPVPTPGPGWTLLRVAAVGICGSDIHGYTGETGRRRPGQIMGHEASAWFVRSSGVEARTAPTGLSPGRLVTFNPVVVPEDSDACAGREQHHPDRIVIGVEPSVDAALAEYLVVPTRNVVPLAPDLDPALGTLVEPLAVALHAVRRVATTADRRALIIGGGPIGQMIVTALMASGVRDVLVSELDPQRRALCETLGAAVMDPQRDTMAQVVASRGGRLPLAFDAVGTTTSLQAAIEGCGQGASIVLVGMASPALTLAAYDISASERSLIGSFTYTRDDFRDAARMVGEQRTGLADLVSREIGPEDADEWFAILSRGAGPPGKVIVTFGGFHGQ